MRLFPVLLGLLLIVGCGRGGGEPTPVAMAGADTSATQTPPDAPAAERTEPARAAGDAPVLEQEFVYGSTEDHNIVGFFAAPQDIIEPLPGVVLIHDGWGLDGYVRETARRLAREGYAVLAVDLYDGALPTTPEEADTLIQRVAADSASALANIRQAYNYLDQFALAPRIGLLGYDAGAGWAFDAAIEHAGEVDAVAIYYGRVVADEGRLEALEAPLLGIFAELDNVVPVRDVQNFRNTLRDLGKRADVYIYPGMRHAFARPGQPGFSDPEAREAWGQTVEFLAAELKSAN